jgi:pimeloyl-ACP methyl ester carboxylesterase
VIGALLVAALTTVTALPHAKTGKGPAIVLVHGLGGDRHAWDDVVPALARTHTVITVDLPGHGAAPADKLDADEIARAIAATIRAEKAEPAVIVGHSLGGFLSAHVPLVDAKVARALVLVDIGIAGLWTGDEVAQMTAALEKDREATLRGWFGAISQPAQLERLLVGLRKLSNATLFGYMRVMRDQPTAGSKLTLPVLLMASPFMLPGKKTRADELAPFGFAGMPKLEVVRFDQSKHWPMWDEPDKFLSTLTHFLASVER